MDTIPTVALVPVERAQHATDLSSRRCRVNAKSGNARPVGHKRLWEALPPGYPDNYIACETFFASFKVNSGVVPVALPPLLCQGAWIVLQLTGVLWLLMLYYQLCSAQLPNLWVLFASVCGYCVLGIVPLTVSHTHTRPWSTLVSLSCTYIITGVIFGILLVVLTPLIGSLSAEIADDSFWAIVMVLLAVHLISLRTSSNPDALHTNPLVSYGHSSASLLSGVIATLFLASRLDQHGQVLVFSGAGLILVVFWPMICPLATECPVSVEPSLCWCQRGVSDLAHRCHRPPRRCAHLYRGGGGGRGGESHVSVVGLFVQIPGHRRLG